MSPCLSRRFVSLFAVLLTTFSFSNVAKAQQTIFVNFDADWLTSLADVASDAGIDAFTAGEITTIETGIVSKLETMYSAYGALSFSTASGTGTLDFGAMTTDGNGVLGVSPSLDFGNIFDTTTVSVFMGLGTYGSGAQGARTRSSASRTICSVRMAGRR